LKSDIFRDDRHEKCPTFGCIHRATLFGVARDISIDPAGVNVYRLIPMTTSTSRSVPYFAVRLITIAAMCIASKGVAQISNGGFETGNLSSWTGNGVASAAGTTNGIAPANGSFQGVMSTGIGTVSGSTPGLNSFLNIAAGAIVASANAAGAGGVTETQFKGWSAIKQTFVLGAGEGVTFDFAAAGDVGFNSLHRGFYSLSEISTSSTAVTFLGDKFFTSSSFAAEPYETFSTPTVTVGGTYVFGFSAVQFNTGIVFSEHDPSYTLLVDNVVVVPEPATYALLAAGLALAGWSRTRRRTQV
jgi:hypothetical protein